MKTKWLKRIEAETLIARKSDDPASYAFHLGIGSGIADAASGREKDYGLQTATDDFARGYSVGYAEVKAAEES